MERTRTVDTLSNAVDNAFATVILSPDTFPFRHLEPYKQKIDAVIEKVISKHKIGAATIEGNDDVPDGFAAMDG